MEAEGTLPDILILQSFTARGDVGSRSVRRLGGRDGRCSKGRVQDAQVPVHKMAGHRYSLCIKESLDVYTNSACTLRNTWSTL